MNLGIMAKPFIWNEENLKYKEVLERDHSLSKLHVMGLIREMDKSNQKRMARTLQFSFSQRTFKKWPEMMFIKDIHLFVQQAQHDANDRLRLVLAILQAVSSVYSDDEDPLSVFLSNEEELIMRHGFWHYYWAFMLYPINEDETELWKETRLMLEEKAIQMEEGAGRANEEAAPATEVLTPTSNPSENRTESDDGNGSKLSVLEKKLAKETERRLGLELELAQSQKTIRKQEKELEQFRYRLQEEKKQSELHYLQTETVTERLEKERKYHKDAQARWLDERDSLINQIRTLERELQQQEKHSGELLERLEHQQKSMEELKQAHEEPDQFIVQLTKLLNRKLEHISRDLNGQSDLAYGQPLREHIRKIIDLLDALDIFCREATPTPYQELSSQHILPVQQSTPPIYTNEENKSKEVVVEEVMASAEDAASDVYVGTFYRRDHGGYIELETDETFNITESMVYRLNLQHEAEVQCRPYKQSNDGNQLYDIELLFQGDDTFSPISQYEGYVELREHQTWYCVELNNPDHSYPLHYKDLEKQKPLDGTPCTFNIADGGIYARISRLYRDFMTPRKAEVKEETSRRPAERGIQDKIASKQKPEPFLEGCIIAIVGGQRKWFEDVIMETGAELIHDTGDSPDRITSVLRRANAMFMLLTSTSHRATWAGIEIAKQFGIPHFTIQGSKSNLRKQLWDNRDQIKAVQ